jgi:hypothetical protein
MNDDNRNNVGSVRPSQLLWTYGPGSVVDLPSLSVITMGLNQWDEKRCRPIDESRLLDSVKRILGPQVLRLYCPPVITDDNAHPMSAEAKIGVPVRPFPRWFRCVRCGLLGEFDSGLFDLEANAFNPDKTRFVHRNCSKGGKSDAVPARFLLACQDGHLDDFPWHWFVHGGPSDCNGTLSFFERGASLQTENLWVKCNECDASRSMVHAFGERAQTNLPGCRGRHPHLDSFDSDCHLRPRTVLLGATNGWFPVSLSVLSIPLDGDNLGKIIQDGWGNFGDLESKDELKIVLRTVIKNNLLPGIENYDIDNIWAQIKNVKAGTGSNERGLTELEIKVPEWEVLTKDKPKTDWPHFMLHEEKAPDGYETFIDTVRVLDRLREVNALVGFTRIDAPDEFSSEENTHRASLTKGSPYWVPANEVHGEGIFIIFKEERIKQWEELSFVKERSNKLRRGHVAWRRSRGLNPNEGYPPDRFTMIHTLAHLLIRELALECGYNAASIRERVYANVEGINMAGLLIYTAAADSDGTLGGLAEMGKPENLGRILSQALNRSLICSSDPLCSEHAPNEDRSLHQAACHACSFVSETSCEKGNRYLDRGFLVPTYETSDTGFFNSLFEK